LPCHSKVTLELVYFIFLSETWNMMIWDGLVQPTRKYCSICHLEYPEFQTGIISLGQSDYVLNVTFTMGWFTGIQALILKQMALIDNEKSIINRCELSTNKFFIHLDWVEANLRVSQIHRFNTRANKKYDIICC